MSDSRGSLAMMAEPKPGDRFEIALTGSPGRLSLPAVWARTGSRSNRSKTPKDVPWSRRSISDGNLLIVPKLAQDRHAPGATHCGWNTGHRADSD